MLETLELEVQMVMSCGRWELKSSRELNPGAISPASLMT